MAAYILNTSPAAQRTRGTGVQRHGITSNLDHDRSALHWTIQQMVHGQRGVQESAFADCVEVLLQHTYKYLPKRKFDETTFPIDSTTGNTPLHLMFNHSNKESDSHKHVLKMLLDSCEDSAVLMVNKKQDSAHDKMVMKNVDKTSPECSRLLRERHTVCINTSVGSGRRTCRAKKSEAEKSTNGNEADKATDSGGASAGTRARATSSGDNSGAGRGGGAGGAGRADGAGNTGSGSTGSGGAGGGGARGARSTDIQARWHSGGKGGGGYFKCACGKQFSNGQALRAHMDKCLHWSRVSSGGKKRSQQDDSSLPKESSGAFKQRKLSSPPDRIQTSSSRPKSSVNHAKKHGGRGGGRRSGDGDGNSSDGNGSSSSSSIAVLLGVEKKRASRTHRGRPKKDRKPSSAGSFGASSQAVRSNHRKSSHHTNSMFATFPTAAPSNNARLSAQGKKKKSDEVPELTEDDGDGFMFEAFSAPQTSMVFA